MNELNKNKGIILGCVVIIIITLLLVFILNRESFEEEFYMSDSAFLRNYGINEVIPIRVTEEDMAGMYLAEIVGIIMNNPREAYDLLAEDYREIALPTFEEFMKYVELMHSERFSRGSLEKFEVRTERGYRIYDVVDIDGNNFIFRVTSIFNYTILLDNDTIIN